MHVHAVTLTTPCRYGVFGCADGRIAKSVAGQGRRERSYHNLFMKQFANHLLFNNVLIRWLSKCIQPRRSPCDHVRSLLGVSYAEGLVPVDDL